MAMKRIQTAISERKSINGEDSFGYVPSGEYLSLNTEYIEVVEPIEKVEFSEDYLHFRKFLSRVITNSGYCVIVVAHPEDFEDKK